MRLSPGMEKAKEGENILIKNCSICIESRCCGWKKFLVSKLIFHYFIFNEFIELFDEINWKTLWPFYEKFWAKYSLFGKDLLAGGPYGRKAIQEKDVPFIEKLPLSLKNIVANTSMKGGQKACMDQMMEVLIVCHFILFKLNVLLGYQLPQQIWSEPVHVQQRNCSLPEMLLNL